MGNSLFRCRTTSTNVVRGNKQRRHRRSFWEKILSSCGFKAPSKRGRSSTIGKFSSNYEEPGWRNSAKHQRSARYSSRSRCTNRTPISASQENARESLLHAINVGHVNSSTSLLSAISSNYEDMARNAPRSRSTNRASVSLSEESPCESLLHPTKEGRHVNSSASLLYAVSSSSPDGARKLFNNHCYQKLPGYSSTSHSSPISDDSLDMMSMPFNPHCYQKLQACRSTSYSSPISSSSPDMKNMSFNQHCHQKLQGHSPTSLPSPINTDSPDLTTTSSNQHFYKQLHLNSATSLSSPTSSDYSELTRMSFYQHSYEQQHVDSPTSLSPPSRSCSPDMMRKSFNQYCLQQRHSASLRKCQSPRRHNKAGSGKSSRRKRSGMRSPSHRTSKAIGRAVSGRTEDNEEKRYGMRSEFQRVSSFKTLGIALTEDKSYKWRSPPHRTSNSRTSLERALKSSMDDDNEDNSDGLRSQSRTNSNSKSPGRNARWSIEDNGGSGTPYTSFYDGQVTVVNIISRSAARALIGRQKSFANRRNVTRSSQPCRKHWTPALESILEAVD